MGLRTKTTLTHLDSRDSFPRFRSFLDFLPSRSKPSKRSKNLRTREKILALIFLLWFPFGAKIQTDDRKTDSNLRNQVTVANLYGWLIEFHLEIIVQQLLNKSSASLNIIPDLFGCKARFRSWCERRRRRRRLLKSGSKNGTNKTKNNYKFDKSKLPVIITTEPSTIDPPHVKWINVCSSFTIICLITYCFFTGPRWLFDSTQPWPGSLWNWGSAKCYKCRKLKGRTRTDG